MELFTKQGGNDPESVNLLAQDYKENYQKSLEWNC